MCKNKNIDDWNEIKMILPKSILNEFKHNIKIVENHLNKEKQQKLRKIKIKNLFS